MPLSGRQHRGAGPAAAQRVAAARPAPKSQHRHRVCCCHSNSARAAVFPAGRCGHSAAHLAVHGAQVRAAGCNGSEWLYCAWRCASTLTWLAGTMPARIRLVFHGTPASDCVCALLRLLRQVGGACPVCNQGSIHGTWLAMPLVYYLRNSSHWHYHSSQASDDGKLYSNRLAGRRMWIRSLASSSNVACTSAASRRRRSPLWKCAGCWIPSRTTTSPAFKSS